MISWFKDVWTAMSTMQKVLFSIDASSLLVGAIASILALSGVWAASAIIYKIAFLALAGARVTRAVTQKDATKLLGGSGEYFQG